MRFIKKKLYDIEKCYSIAPLRYNGSDHLLIAAEKKGPCIMFSPDGVMEETIWDGTGGTMSMVQVPESNGQFLATQKFYSPNDSSEAEIVLAVPRGKNLWETKALVRLPFVHRFDVITKNGVNYLIACTIKSSHSFKDDWSSPGKVYAGILPKDLTGVDEYSLRLDVIYEGLFKNHGYYRSETKNEVCAVIGTESGVFKAVPPDSEEDSWHVEKILDAEVSDMIFVDFDGDGVDELLTISPFHGDEVNIYKLDGGEYKNIYTHPDKLEFLHGIWGGYIYGVPCAAVGHRKGKQQIMVFTCPDTDNNKFEAKIIDENAGSANLHHYVYGGREFIVSTNREHDEVALYEIRM